MGDDVAVSEDLERGLFSAVVSVAAGLDLHATLRRIIQAAVDLVQARYGALGVLGPDGIEQFITIGLDAETVELLGTPPTGKGVLGTLIKHPLPLRIDDLTTSADAVGFPQGHPIMRSFLGVPLVVRGEVFGNLYLTEKLGAGPFTAEDERTVVALGAAAAAAIENARLFERTRRREQWQQVVSEMANRVLSGGSVADAAAVLVHRARELLGSSGILIALPGHATPDGTPATVTTIVAGESSPQVSVNIDVPLTDPLLIEAWLTGASQRRRAHGIDPALVGGDSAAPMGPVVALPLRTQQRMVGALVAWRSEETFRAPAITTIEPLLEQAALTLLLAESQEKQERLAVFVERDRIARDLHDLVIQRLFATGLLLQRAIRSDDLPDEASDVITRVTQAIDQLDVTIKEIRQTIFALQDPSGADVSLRDRLLAEVEYATALLGRRPQTRVVGSLDWGDPRTWAAPSSMVVDGPAAAAAGDHLVAVLREALANVAKHAGATEVVITVTALEGELTVEVMDDGIGFAHDEDHGRLSGLANLQGRAIELGGSLTVARRTAAGGTVLRWTVPLTWLDTTPVASGADGGTPMT